MTEINEKKRTINKKEKTFNSEELIYQLCSLCLDKKFKKPDTLPMFNLKEALFIRDLIFQKPKDLVFFYIMDHMRNRTEVGRMGMFNARGYRLYRFWAGFVENMGNCTKAAIYAGYSPRSAKQQGYRALKRLQRYY